MFRALACTLPAALCVALLSNPASADVTGTYLEARTCQVYTGPCFANAEVGLAGKDAVMAWSIDQGSHEGVDVSGLNVIMVLRTSDTLGFRGIEGVRELKSVVFVDERADQSQQLALAEFAKSHAGKAGAAVVRVETTPIAMDLDVLELNGSLEAGKIVKLKTRKARPGDCICSNESAYYPPLTKVENFAPGVTMEGEYSGRGLSSRWSIPGSRSAYMATFRY
ncbi:MAG: DUF1326 domain-containing protein [Pirellulaceae bacterium]